MAVKTFTQAEQLTAADTNTYLNNGGLVFVKQVTVGSGVASVDITSCFSATYDNYVVSYSGVASSAAVAGLVYLLSGTTPTTTGMYGNTFYVVTGAAGAFTNATIVNQGYCEVTSLRNGDVNSGTFQITAPFLANYTRFSWQSTASDYWRIGGYSHNASTSYDGFRFQPFSGTLTGGKITVYGYRLG